MVQSGLIGQCEDCGGKDSYLRVIEIDPQDCQPLGPRVVITNEAFTNSQIIPFDSTTPISLTVPTGANSAMLSIEGGAIRYTTDGSPPNNGTKRGHKTQDGQHIELEGLSEVSGFRLLGLAGQSGSIYVEYSYIPYKGITA